MFSLSDTSQKTNDVYLKLLREKNISQKIKYVSSISSFIINLSKKTIKNSNPGFNKQDVDLLFVKINYGNNIYEKLKKHFSIKNG